MPAGCFSLFSISHSMVDVLSTLIELWMNMKKRKKNKRAKISHEMRLHVGDIMKWIFELCCWVPD